MWCLTQATDFSPKSGREPTEMRLHRHRKTFSLTLQRSQAADIWQIYKQRHGVAILIIHLHDAIVIEHSSSSLPSYFSGRGAPRRKMCLRSGDRNSSVLCGRRRRRKKPSIFTGRVSSDFPKIVWTARNRNQLLQWFFESVAVFFFFLRWAYQSCG